MVRRQDFDDALPTLTRYVGLVVTVVLITFTALGHGLEVAPAWPAAAGLLLYPGVHAARKNGNENGGAK